MRPVRLRLQGFTTFRSMSEPIDFSDADLFALTGPTGSGKSSIVDAICFALYGSVPRLDKGKVEPIISLGAQEARIHFEFTVEGRPYIVARVVKRTKSGATTAEATLEGGEETVSGADQVTETVERLLGLPFEDFTKSVVLPQGEFAAFLHDKPAKRQDLLRRLLDLGVYEHMRRLAHNRKAALEVEASVLERQVADLTAVDAEAEALARVRARQLEELRTVIEEAGPDLSRLTAAIAESERALRDHAEHVVLLGRLRQPEGVDRIAASSAAAVDAVEKARERASDTTEMLERAEKKLAGLGDATYHAETIRLHDLRADLATRLSKGRELITVTDAEIAAAIVSLEAATSARAEAVAGERKARTAHAAHALRSELADGDTCPVCLQRVADVPDVEIPEALGASEAGRMAAEDAERAAAAEHQRLSARLAAYQERLVDIETQLASADRELLARPGADETASLLEQIAAAKSEVDLARRTEQERRAEVEEATAGAERARLAEADAWEAFDRARDAVGALGPPSVHRSDLAEAWTALVEWGVSLRDRFVALQTFVEAEIDEARRQRDELLSGMVAQAAALGVFTDGSRLREDVIVASVDANNAVERIEERTQRARDLESDARHRRAGADLATALARHLSAAGFQAWILEEAFLGLVASANQMLDQLSQGAYSLHVERRDFVVVDHRNADDTRSVRTLSGGETFLVSLALALALAEQLSMLAGAGGARLESIFLDEGFGTLDSETLETVSTVIQELGATGRTVGIITHVTELAEQVPVRFEIRRLPGGSTVTKVEG